MNDKELDLQTAEQAIAGLFGEGAVGLPPAVLAQILSRLYESAHADGFDSGKRTCREESHHLAVWFTPDAIREACEGDDEREQKVAALTDEELAEAAEGELSSADLLWRDFHERCDSIVDELYEERAKAGTTPKPEPSG